MHITDQEANETRKKIITANLKKLAEIKGHPYGENDPKLEEDVNKVYNDQKKIELHNKAVKFIEKFDGCDKKSHGVVNRLEAELGRKINIDPGLSRSYMYVLDYSGTEEAYQKNKEYLLSLEDPENARRQINKDLSDALKVDKKILFPKDTDELFKNIEENPALFNALFVISSEIDNSQFAMTPELKELYEKNKTFLQTAGSLMSQIRIMATTTYVTMPDMDVDDIGLVFASVNDFVNILTPYVDEGLETDYKGMPESGEYGTAGQDVSYMFTQSLYGNDITGTYAKEKRAYEMNLVPENVCTDYVFTENGRVMHTEDAICALGEGRYIEVIKKNPLEIATTEKMIDNGIYSPGTVKGALAAKYDRIVQITQSLHAARAKIGFLNSPEYKTLMTALDAFCNNPDNNIGIMNHRNLANRFPEVADNVRANMASLTALAQAYVDKKATQTRNETRQLRFDLCKELVNVTDTEEIRRMYHSLTPAEVAHEQSLEKNANADFSKKPQGKAEVKAEEKENMLDESMVAQNGLELNISEEDEIVPFTDEEMKNQSVNKSFTKEMTEEEHEKLYEADQEALANELTGNK